VFHASIDLIYISVWPLLLTVFLLFFARRLYSLLSLRTIGNKLMSLRQRPQDCATEIKY
jgi:hypothetical protein